MTRNFSTLARAALVISPALVAGLGGASASAHDIRQLGDGKYSDSPKAGYLFSCQTQFSANAPGAPGGGSWISGDTYDLDEKPTVEGSVMWPNAEITVTREGDLRIVRANNLPTHPTGVFPIARNDDAFQYDRNPNAIRVQNILLRLPADPETADRASCVPMGMIGFTLTGGALFNAIDARGRDAAAYEILDKCGGHPQQNGQYHYHDAAACLPHGRDASGGSELIGYALDGFGIYGPYDASGQKLANADLDGCHGKVGPVMWDGKLVNMYHYVMTDEYPYSIGCFRGTPVSVSAQRAPSGGPQPQQSAGVERGPGQQPAGGGGPRGDVLVAIAGDLGVDLETLRPGRGRPAAESSARVADARHRHRDPASRLHAASTALSASHRRAASNTAAPPSFLGAKSL